MIFYFLFGSFFLIGTVFSAKRLRSWWVKGFNAASFHLLVGMAVLLIFGFCCFDTSRSSVFMMQAFLLTGFIFQFLKILPFTPLFKEEVEKIKGRRDAGIRFISANVRMSNTNYKRLQILVKKYNPDVLLLTEPDQKWISGIDFLKTNYPHSLLQPQDNTYGMALFSKLPFRMAETRFLVEEDVPSFHVELLTSSGEVVQFIGMHPRPPAPWTKTENKDFELIKAAGMTNWNSLPSVVTGDLNDVGWSQVTHEFKSISGLLDPRIGRGFFNTYNAFIPFFRIPIDHFFVSRHFKLVEMKKLERFGSDHFPVMLEVALGK